ncbi:hypothetical protein BV22DRAFT_892506 [Leucogyrophana mollusca]|uniref:Uncharacterized protein n=1 Tax=Leucogyrophana mollusca TaxID=85980 RepID=A0ACB8AZ88_9AGAM|nr:hypothetical protein BV22DRAFT_892506 [Leucogyrophana mollusca]
MEDVVSLNWTDAYPELWTSLCRFGLMWSSSPSHCLGQIWATRCRFKILGLSGRNQIISHPPNPRHRFLYSPSCLPLAFDTHTLPQLCVRGFLDPPPRLSPRGIIWASSTAPIVAGSAPRLCGGADFIVTTSSVAHVLPCMPYLSLFTCVLWELQITI